jgi:SAM-dependent methyltransferase
MEYLSDELESLAYARNYYSWILEEFQPFIGKAILEVGAGLGTFSSFLLDTAPERLILVEPASNLIPFLKKRFSVDKRVKILCGSIESLTTLDTRIDTIVSVNVLEHIKDDIKALKIMHDILPKGGMLLLYVPALSFLFGKLDYSFNHYRRYEKNSLLRKLKEARFEILKCKYINLVGVASWFLSSRVLRKKMLNPFEIKVYDKFIIPVIRLIESRFDLPLGQNLLVVGEK